MGFPHKALQGAGWVSLVPTGTNPDPLVLFNVKGLTFEIKEDSADLLDENGEIIDSFVTGRTMSGKITCADMSNSLLTMVTRGVTVAAGEKLGATHSAAIPATPFELTVTQGATFADDLGVIDLTSGKEMKRDATATGTNVYAVNTATGVYTFNTADSGHTVLIYYRYTAAATGTTADIAAATTGVATRCALHCYQTTSTRPWGLYVPNAQISNLSGSFKREGFSEVSLDWKAIKPATGSLFYSYQRGGV